VDVVQQEQQQQHALAALFDLLILHYTLQQHYYPSDSLSETAGSVLTGQRITLQHSIAGFNH
jgi:hypothetical protein